MVWTSEKNNERLELYSSPNLLLTRVTLDLCAQVAELLPPSPHYSNCQVDESNAFR